LKTAAYTAVVGDVVLCNTTTADVPIALPSAPADKSRIIIRHAVQVSPHKVVISAGGTDVFNVTSGVTSLNLTILGETVLLQYVAASGVWLQLSDDFLLTQSTLLGFYSVAPVVQPQTTGTVTGFTAGASTATKVDSTYTGNTGTSAYTVGDVVLALKQLGLLKA
jgi:hypothetical protein